MKAYKAFNRDMTCLDFRYKEGETYEIDGAPVLCDRGFHFCKDLVLTLAYYSVNEDITENKYAEVEILGEAKFEQPHEHKGVTNKIRILRIIPDDEVLKMVDRRDNSGDWNSGDWNSGNSNSGDWNSGDWNSGNSNSGHWNSGDSNSGRWNACNRETGFFNTAQSEMINVFNKPCPIKEWEEAYKPDFLYFKLGNNYKESFQTSWDETDPRDREKIRDLPNFDAEIFFELSGIDLR